MNNDTPYRLPADMTDVDELKAYIRQLEKEIHALEAAPPPVPRWALRFQSYTDPDFVFGVFSGVLGAVFAGLGAGHAAALAAQFSITAPYMLFLLYVGHTLTGLLPLAYAHLSWLAWEGHATGAHIPALPRNWSIRRWGSGASLYYEIRCSEEYEATCYSLRGAVDKANEMAKERADQ